MEEMKERMGGRLGKGTLDKVIREGVSEDETAHRGTEAQRGEVTCPRSHNC